MSSTNKKHDWLVNKIYDTPDLVGVQHPTSKVEDYTMLYKGQYFVVPDLYFSTPQQNHFVEVKSENDMFLYNKGMRQLEKVMDWHKFHGFEYPEAQLILPEHHKGKYWVDMLDQLNGYVLGDWYNKPTYKWFK